MTQRTSYMQSKYNRRLSHGSHVELVVAVKTPSLYITVVSAVVGSTSIVPTTVSDTVDGHPAAKFHADRCHRGRDICPRTNTHTYSRWYRPYPTKRTLALRLPDNKTAMAPNHKNITGLHRFSKHSVGAAKSRGHYYTIGFVFATCQSVLCRSTVS